MSGARRPAPELEDAFILHARPYQETSQILEVLGAQHGRVGLVARGARRPKSSRWRSVLQPFLPLRLSWVGQGFALHAAGSGGSEFCHWRSMALSLMGAFYLNELVLNFRPPR